MVRIDLRIDNEAKIKAKLGDLQKKSKLVMARASNRAAVTGRKVIKQETAKKYLVRQKDVNDIVTIKKAAGRGYASIEYKDSHKNLAIWPMQGKNLSPYQIIQFDSEGKPNVKVYMANVLKATGKRKLAGIRKPFLQIAKSSGRIGLFKRTGGKNREIEGVSGPAFPQIIKNPEVMKRFEEEAGDMLEKRVEHEIDVILKSGGKGKIGGEEKGRRKKR